MSDPSKMYRHPSSYTPIGEGGLWPEISDYDRAIENGEPKADVPKPEPEKPAREIYPPFHESGLRFE